MPQLKTWRECFYEAMERAMRAEDTITRVRALADEDTHHLRSGVVGMVRLSDLDAALRGPEPTEESS